MKFSTSTKMAAHNLVVNKSRTILTIIIVFVVSSLIMALCLIGTNFYSNIMRGYEQVFDKSGTKYEISPKDSTYNNNMSNNRIVETTLLEVNKVAQVAKKHPGVVDNMIVNDFQSASSYANFSDTVTEDRSSVGYAYYDFPFNNNIGEMVSGRIWTAADNDTNKAWIDESIVKEYASNGVALNLGSTFSVATSQRYYGEDKEPQSVEVEYEVAGIFASNENFTGNIIVSAPYSFDKIKSLNITIGNYRALTMSFTPKANSYNYNEASKNIKAFVKEVNTELGTGKDWDGKEIDRFASTFLSELVMTEIISLLILGVLILLSFFILLLSIGSVANTIIISVDKNRKFIGLMKAMGLNNKGMKQIVYKEALITILIGVGLAMLAILAAQAIMLKLLNSITGSLFMMLLQSDFTATFVLNPLVPIITALAFVGFAILFARGSLNKMGKMDVISIINEVA